MFQFPFRFLSLGTLLLCAAALFALQLLPERRAALAAALSTRRWLAPCERIIK